MLPLPRRRREKGKFAVLLFQSKITLLVKIRFHFSIVISILSRLNCHLFIMPYFVVTAKEKKKGAKSRRKIVLEAAGMESAKAAFIDKCSNLDVEPNFITLRQVSRIEYEAIIATLMEKKPLE
jgi:hypothetical protein